MRKALPITLIFLLLTLSMTPLATAQKQNIIVNETTETLYIISSTKFGAQDDIPAGYRTSGWKTVAAGQQRAFWAYDPHKIYFQIWKAGKPIKPQHSTDTFAFWINRNAGFDIVTQQEINDSITRAELLYSSQGTNPLTHRDGFIRYNNGSQITVTNAWVDVEETVGEEPPEEETVEAPMEETVEAPMVGPDLREIPARIPDANLRTAIEEALGKSQGDTITATDMQKLTALSATAQGIQDLTGLEFATNLTTLTLNSNRITDVSSLAGLTNLTALYLNSNRITDVSSLAGLTNLTALYLNSNRITDVSSLVGLTNLTTLELTGNNILDVSPLAGLTNLIELWLDSNAISDFSPIAGLIPNLAFYSDDNQRALPPPDPQLRAAIAEALGKAQGDTITATDMQKLTALFASEQGIQDLTGLEFATNLTQLHLTYNQITDVSALAGLTNLTTLDLTYNQITDVSALAGLTNLTTLDLNSNQIDVSALAGLTNLTTLDLGGNAISDVSPLAGLTNLTTLHLVGNAISDVSPLAGLTNLTTLKLEYNAIFDFSPIAGLIPNLEFYSDDTQRALVPDPQLRADIEHALGKAQGDTITATDMQELTALVAYGSEPRIEDLTGLEFATNLTDLWLDDNAISDVSPLAGLTNLESLRLDDNQITDVSALADLTNLRLLQLTNNQITDVSALAGLINLTTLELTNNQITDVSALAGLTNLVWLYLDYNRITDVSALVGLTNLAALTLDYNAISDFSPISELIPTLGFYSDDTQRAGGWNQNDLVNIPDPGLRSAIEKALRKFENTPITKTEMEGLTLFQPSSVIMDLTGLEFATNLTTLWLDCCEITDVSALAGLTNLTTLKLESNNISDVSPLGGLINLTTLWLNGNAISDVSPLTGLTNLTTLLLKENAISDVSPLAGLTNLTTLLLNENQLTDVSPLSGLTNLTELTLSENAISNVSPLSGLTNLTGLGLWSNAISDVSPLSGLTNLTWLSLWSNAISDVSPLAGLTNLTSLSLAYNNISDFTSLDGLKEAGVEITTHSQGFVEISQIGYSPLDAGVSVSVSGITPGKLRLERELRSILTYTVVNKDSEPVQGITLSLLVFPTSGASFHPSTITTDAKGQAKTSIYFDGSGKFDLWANVKVSEKTINQHGNTVYKQYDGNQTVLIKGLELSDVNEFTYDHTQFYPPRHGKHFRIYGQGDVNTCGQTSARMVLSYYGVDVGLHTFDDVADIHTWVVGATPSEMRAGLKLLPVDLETYSGTSENYPRDQSLRDKISESRPPILVIRVAKNGYHHVVVVGYDTRTNNFLIADPGVKGYFHWMPWAYLNPEWRLDYIPGLTWEDYWKDFTDLNKLGSAPFVPDVKFVIKWFGGLAPYRMFVPEEAPPYHHLESKTVEIYETGDVEWDPTEWGWHDWKREETFDGKVIATSWFAERRNGDVREVRREGNKVIVSGRISNGVPLDADIWLVDEVFYGAVDMVLTAYYDPSVRAAPSIVFPPLSKGTALLPNYPNPFNPETWIPYHLVEPANVTLTIYAIDGKVVRRLDLGHQDAGYYQSKARAAYWDGRNSVGERVASGIYFYTLTAGDFAATRKMLIMK